MREMDRVAQGEAPGLGAALAATPIGVEGDWLPSERFLSGATRAFVALGLLLRVVRYLMDFPLWSDEARLAANFVHAGFGDLGHPLRYQQVAPLGYLAVEMAAIRLLGFSTWSLRLFAFACSLASVPLFRHVAGRFLRGLPLLLAVAFFSVAWWPVRLGAETKPYASDLLLSLALLALALEWLRSPERPAWLWGLAGTATLAVTLSFPSVLVVGGLVVALPPTALRTRRLAVAVPLLALTVAPAALFAALLPYYRLDPRVQAYMERYWADAFPPRDGLSHLVRWLVQVHTGTLFAYPAGCESGGSLITAAGFFVGAFVLWRRRQRTLLAIGVVPLILNFAAAVPHRYPYGDQARTMQYFVPAVCLFAGLGLASLIGSIRRPGMRRSAAAALLLACLVIAAVHLAFALVHPYELRRDRRLREFARRFWTEVSRDAEVECAECHLGVVAWPEQWEGGNWTNYFECYERMYAPCCRRAAAGGFGEEAPGGGPLRVVFFNERPEDGALSREWLAAMRRAYEVRSIRAFTLRLPERRAPDMVSRYLVYEFLPLGGPLPYPRPPRRGLQTPDRTPPGWAPGRGHHRGDIVPHR